MAWRQPTFFFLCKYSLHGNKNFRYLDTLRRHESPKFGYPSLVLSNTLFWQRGDYKPHYFEYSFPFTVTRISDIRTLYGDTNLTNSDTLFKFFQIPFFWRHGDCKPHYFEYSFPFTVIRISDNRTPYGDTNLPNSDTLL